MSARDSRFGGFGSGSTKSKAAGAAIACAVMLLAGCGGSAADAGAPVIRGDAPVAPATLTVSNTTMTGTVGTPITLTSAGGDGTDKNFASSTNCAVTDTLLAPISTATAPVTCSVTANQGALTSAAVTFTFAAAVAVAPGPPLPPTVVAGDRQLTVTVAPGPGGIPVRYTVNVLSQLQSHGGCYAFEPDRSCVVIRLTNDVPYTVTASASNIVTTSVATEALTTFTPTKPTKPTNLATVVFNTTEGNSASMPDQTASTPTALRANGNLNGDATRVFMGWAIAKRGEVVYADKATYPFDKDATLYAIWRSAGEPLNIVAALTGPTTASVSFQSVPNRDGTPAVRSSYDLTLVRGGGAAEEVRNVPGPGTYLFNLAPGNSYDFRVDGFVSNVIVTPAATANLRSVEFYKGRGIQGTMLPQWASEPTALPSNVYSLPGYRFAGWAQVTAQGQMPQPGTLAFADGATYPFNSSVRLYPRWVAPTVTFDANDGVGSIPNQSALTATPLTLNANALNTTAFTRSGYAFGGWATTRTGSMAYADGATYPFTETATLYATWGCLPLTVTVSAKRVGANKAEVYFTAPSSESPWKSFAANAAKEGGKGATRTTDLNTGTITVTGLDKNSGYTFDVTATNAAGCTYKATANRLPKW